MKSEEAAAAVEVLGSIDGVSVDDRGTFYLVEAEQAIRIDLDTVAEHLGRDLPMRAFLVVMVSYYGRVTLEPTVFTVTPDLPDLDEVPRHRTDQADGDPP
jgi:deoxycytidine triphosphate deaminase